MDITSLYEKYGPMIMRRCRQILSDEHIAKDAMQEVFVNVLKKRDTLDFQFPSSLLYTIATNVSLNMLQKHKRRNEVLHDEELLYEIACQDTIVENKTLLNFLFKKEKLSTRVMAVYHFVDGLTLEETAKELSMSVSGVRKRLREMKERLHSIQMETINET